MRTFNLLVLTCFAALAGCAARAIDVGSDSNQESIPGDGGQPADASPAAYFTAAQVQAAQQACNAPHGQVDSYSDVTGLRSRLVGAWFLCGTNTLPEGAGGSSVWEADGSWHRLVPDGQGGLVEGTGLQDTGAYQILPLDDASDSCDPSGCILGFGLKTGGAQQYGDQFSAAFETSPRRMLLGETDWYVPLQ